MHVRAHRAPVDAAPGGERLPADEDVLLDREVGEEDRLLVDDRDAGVAGVAPGRSRKTCCPSTRSEPASGGWTPGEDLHERRLAGAVLAHERRAPRRAKRSIEHVLERLDGAERLRRVLERQDRAAARASPLTPRLPARTAARRRSRRSGRAPRPRPPVVLRLVDDGLERRADDLARVGDRAELAERDGLDEQVADDGRLDRAGEHGQPGRGGGPAAEQLVARAAADDVHLRRLGAGRRAQEVDRLRMLQREALQDAAHDGPGLLGTGLAALRAELRGSAAACRPVPRSGGRRGRRAARSAGASSASATS